MPLVSISDLGIYQLLTHTPKVSEKWKHILCYIIKRAIIEQAASIEQNQSQVTLSLLLVYHILYNGLHEQIPYYTKDTLQSKNLSMLDFDHW